MGNARGHVVALLGGQATVALPVAVEISTTPEAGVGIVAAGGYDRAWASSASRAWVAAQALSGVARTRATITLAARARLCGPSAGLALGLLMLSASLRVDLPSHLASGTILDHRGHVNGAVEVEAKLRGLASKDAPFVTPPAPDLVAAFPRHLMVTDLASAFASLVPDAYERVRDRHRALCRAPAPSVDGLVLDESPGDGTWARELRGGFQRARLWFPAGAAPTRDRIEAALAGSACALDGTPLGADAATMASGVWP